MSTPLLTGHVKPLADHRDRIIESLEAEVRSLREQVLSAQAESEATRDQMERALSTLRRQLNPLYQALRAVFGEIDAVLPPEMAAGPSGVPPDARKQAVWDAWKQKLPGLPAKFIDSLLVHGSMSAAQLRVSMHCSNQGVYDTATKLNKLGLLQKNGGKYSLREL